MDTLQTPNDIRNYIKETTTELFGHTAIESIETLRRITDKIIFAIDLYIDFKIDLAIKERMNGTVIMDEVRDIPDSMDSISITKESRWKKRKFCN